jgi:MoaA/NifB/PqqE/SkfB family radical SAM enzyme
VYSAATDSDRTVHIGFALTQHCNLRCAHCIRDDVGTFVEIDANLVLRVLDEARERRGHVAASFTGGEPLLHRDWDRIIDGLRTRGIPYTFVSNGWHMSRFMPHIEAYAPSHVRLSLSGADAEVHDAERGRDSFRRVLHATLLLTTRRIPVSYSFIVDRRTRHQLHHARDLAADMQCAAIRYILPQPVPASAQRDTDLPPAEWWTVRRELQALADHAPRSPRIFLEYGAPSDEPEAACGTKTLDRIYVDAHGRLSTCCQLSEYGGNETDVVADLRTHTFAEAYDEYVRRVNALADSTAYPGGDDALAAFPCMRCARASGKLDWLAQFPASPWTLAAGMRHHIQLTSIRQYQKMEPV